MNEKQKENGENMDTINVKCESCKNIYKILNKKYGMFDVVKCSI